MRTSFILIFLFVSLSLTKGQPQSYRIPFPNHSHFGLDVKGDARGGIWVLGNVNYWDSTLTCCLPEATLTFGSSLTYINPNGRIDSTLLFPTAYPGSPSPMFVIPQAQGYRPSGSFSLSEDGRLFLPFEQVEGLRPCSQDSLIYIPSDRLGLISLNQAGVFLLDTTYESTFCDNYDLISFFTDDTAKKNIDLVLADHVYEKSIRFLLLDSIGRIKRDIKQSLNGRLTSQNFTKYQDQYWYVFRAPLTDSIFLGKSKIDGTSFHNPKLILKGGEVCGLRYYKNYRFLLLSKYLTPPDSLYFGYLLQEIDTLGNIYWERKFEDRTIKDFQVLADHDILLLTRFREIQNDSQYFAVTRLGTRGEEFQTQFYGNWRDVPESLHILNQQEFVAVGSQTQFLGLDIPPSSIFLVRDRFPQKIPASSLSQSISFIDLVHIYPNPTKGRIWIKHELLEPTLTVEIWNLHGKAIYSTQCQSFDPIDLTSIQPGMYWIRILDKDHKIIKQQKLIRS